MRLPQFFQKWLFILFGNYRWCRRLLGGIWRRWWIDVCLSYIWLPDPKISDPNWKPPCSKGYIAVEIYPNKTFYF